MKKRAELLKAFNLQRKVVLDLLQKGNVDEAKTASDELEKIQNELDALPDTVVTERVVKPMDKKEKLSQIKKAVDTFLHRGWNGLSDEQKTLIKATNASDTPGQIETGATRGAALVPVETAAFVMEMPAGVYRLRDRVFNYYPNTKSGKIPMVANPSDTLTDFDEFPANGINRTQVTINQVDFSLHDCGDIVPVSNDLLKDQVASIFDVIVSTFMKKLRNKENAMILAAIDGLGAGTAVHTWQAIADAVNETDPVDGTDKVIITNTDGGNFLADQVDNNHYVLIQPDAASPRKFFRGYEVIQLPLSVLPNTTDSEVPFYVGSLYDAVAFFEHADGGLEISYNPYSDSAFAKNATDVRVVSRLDCKPKFAGAIKKLLYTPA